MMKLSKPVILSSILLITAFAKSRDVILFKNGKEYEVEILKKTDQLVEFRKNKSKDNRVFTVSAKRILAFKYGDGKIVDASGGILSPAGFEYEKTIGMSRTKMKAGVP